MLPLLVRRRPDGLVQIRRVRAADVVLTSDTATILALFAGFVFFAILLAAVESRRARPLRLVKQPIARPPRGAA